MNSVRLRDVAVAAKALEQIVREADRRGGGDRFLSQKDVFGLANAIRTPQMPSSLYHTYTAARSAGATRVTEVIQRIRASKKGITKADRDHSGTISSKERADVKGLSLVLLRETSFLPRYLKKVLALRTKAV